MAVSFDGSSFASAGKDRTLRMWCRTDEPVFIEEEREKEMEAMIGSADIGRNYEAFTAEGGSSAAPSMLLENSSSDGNSGERRRGGDDMDEDFEGFSGGDDGAADAGLGGGAEGSRPSTRSEASLKAGERLMEALEMADHEDEAIRDRLSSGDIPNGSGALGSGVSSSSALAAAKQRPENPLMLGLTPDRYVLRTLKMIKRPDLEEALLVLPFHLVERLVARLASLLEAGGGDFAAAGSALTSRKEAATSSERSKGMVFRGACVEAELCTRCAVFLVRLHHASLAASGNRVQVLLRRLCNGARARTTQVRDTVGSNLAALKLLKRAIDEDRDGAVVRIGDGSDSQKQTRKKKQKQKPHTS